MRYSGGLERLILIEAPGIPIYEADPAYKVACFLCALGIHSAHSSPGPQLQVTNIVFLAC